MTDRARVVRDGDGRFYGLELRCPGCESGAHVLPVAWLPPGMAESPHVAGKPHWSFDGNLERPTLNPSILARCEYGDGRPPMVCHSFVRAGRIEFLGDCTHALAGQTVDLGEFPDTESVVDLGDTPVDP